MRADRGAACGSHGVRAKAWPGAAGPSEVPGFGVWGLNHLGRLEAVPQLLRDAWAVTQCHIPHLGARLPPPDTFLPLQE